MTTPIKGFEDFNVDECLALYLQKRYDKVCQCIFDILKHCNDTYYSSFSKSALNAINSYVGFVFFLLSQESFRIPENWVPFFINASHLFSNLVVISEYKTSDHVIRTVLNQEGNYIKLLFLYDCRSKVVIDHNALVKPNSKLATLWWNGFSTPIPGSTTEHIHTRLVEQYKDMPKNLDLPDIRVQPGYFTCSYLGIDERPVKEWYNKQVKKFTSKIKIKNRPKKKRIAVITDKWMPQTAVYKSSYPQLKALAEKYDLTLVCSVQNNLDAMDLSLFKRTFQVEISPHKIDLSAIENNDFGLAYFPDIGMTDDSVFLSNIKLAPIMVCGYGHPVSTYGSLVDYFIGGLDSERQDLYKDNYSEHLVLIPGLGAHPVDPRYTRKNTNVSGITYINCCWTTAKINWPMLCMLQQIQQEVKTPIHYQFFPSWTCTRYNNFPIITRDLTELFNGHVSIYPNLKYHDYLEKMEQAALSIDSYPFGGYNTVVDSLFTGCPVVTIEGTKFYNRASTALAKRVGVDLSTTSIEECKAKVLQLLNNPELLASYRTKLNDTERLRQLLLDTDEPQYFVKAIDYILAQHPISDKSPIVIQ